MFPGRRQTTYTCDESSALQQQHGHGLAYAEHEVPSRQQFIADLSSLTGPGGNHLHKKINQQPSGTSTGPGDSSKFSSGEFDAGGSRATCNTHANHLTTGNGPLYSSNGHYADNPDGYANRTGGSLGLADAPGSQQHPNHGILFDDGIAKVSCTGIISQHRPWQLSQHPADALAFRGQQRDHHEALAHAGHGMQHNDVRPGQGQAGCVQQTQRPPGAILKRQEELDHLVAVRDLPEPFQGLFPNFRYFNPIQSECFHEAFGSDINMVVSAPTGSGKTCVMELALLRLLSGQQGGGTTGEASGGGFRPPGGTNKAVYVAPLRALVQEKCKDWKARFGAQLGLSVLELSGDSEPATAELEAADVLCTTPEKLDAISRKLSEKNRSATFLSDTRLVLIDEVHLLNESERGSALEAGVVSRLTMVAAFPELREHAIARLRFVAVSATIPNVRDIATWLRVPPQGLKLYGEEMRPVKLRTFVRSYSPASNDFLFERRLDDYLPGVVAQHRNNKPALIFCSSRKGTIESAITLAKVPFVRDAAHGERLAAAASEVGANKGLQKCLLAGVGFHNAAMEPQEREVVERLFLKGDLPVLCSTSTLALGVNLPAHLVVIRGTRRYCGADDGGCGTGYKEYDRSVCLQMVGRAGRPQFDTEGVAVIMTQKEMHERYANLLSGAEPVESCLHECFAEHLNAEVVLSTVRDTDTAMQWLRTTFLYVRIRQSPHFYGLDPPAAAMASEATFDRWLVERLVGQAVARLSAIGLMAQDPVTGALRALEPGRIMAHNYLRLGTMKAITEVPPRAGMVSLVRVLAIAEESSHIRLRRSEKRMLNDINRRVDGDAPIKFPVPADGPAGTSACGRAPKPKERITKATEKIFILLNEALSDSVTDVLDFSMKQELGGVLRVGQRIAAAMGKYFGFRHTFAATANALCLAKSLRQCMWDDSAQTVRQLPDIGPTLAKRLAAAGLGGLRQLAAADPRRVEAVTQKAYPFGNTVRSHLAKFLPPEVQLRLRLSGPAPRSRHPHPSGGQVTVEVELTRLDAGSGPCTSASTSISTPAHLLVGFSGNDRLLRYERLAVETFPSPYKCKVAISLPPQAPRSECWRVLACLILDRICGLDVHANLLLKMTQGSIVVESAGVSDAAAAAAEQGGTAAEPGGRFDEVDDAVLQPSPFPSRPSGGLGFRTIGEDEDEQKEAETQEALRAEGSRTQSAAGRRCGTQQGMGHQQHQPPSQRGKRDRDAGGAGGGGGEGRTAIPRPQVMVEVPPLAVPVFALPAALAPVGAPASPLLSLQPPQQQDAPGQLQQPNQPASSAPSQSLSGAINYLAKRGASGGGSKAATAAGAPNPVGGGAGRRGDKQPQNLVMSGASLAGAKQAPAFARLLSLAKKQAPPPGPDIIAQVDSFTAADAAAATAGLAVGVGSCNVPSGRGGLGDGLTMSPKDGTGAWAGLGKQHGWTHGDATGAGADGRRVGGAEGPETDDGGPWDSVFGSAMRDDEQPREVPPPIGPRGGAAARGQGAGPEPLDGGGAPSPAIVRRPLAPRRPDSGSAPVSAGCILRSSAPQLSPQVLQLQRPGMSSRPVCINLTAGGPHLQSQLTGGSQAALRPQPFGSQSAIFNGHKSRMLAASKHRNPAAALDLMRQRQAKNAEAMAAAGAAGGRLAVRGIPEPGSGVRGGSSDCACGSMGAAAVSSPASSSVSAIRRNGRPRTGVGILNTVDTSGAQMKFCLDEGDGEYDSAAGTAAGLDAVDTGAPVRYDPSLYETFHTQAGARLSASGINASPHWQQLSQHQDHQQGHQLAAMQPRVGAADATANTGDWSEFIDESGVRNGLVTRSGSYLQGSSVWQGSKALRPCYTSTAATSSRGGADGSRRHVDTSASAPLTALHREGAVSAMEVGASPPASRNQQQGFRGPMETSATGFVTALQPPPSTAVDKPGWESCEPPVVDLNPSAVLFPGVACGCCADTGDRQGPPKAPPAVSPMPGGTVGGAVVAAGASFGARFRGGASRYLGLVSMTQRMRKRKAGMGLDTAAQHLGLPESPSAWDSQRLTQRQLWQEGGQLRPPPQQQEQQQPTPQLPQQDVLQPRGWTDGVAGAPTASPRAGGVVMCWRPPASDAYGCAAAQLAPATHQALQQLDANAEQLVPAGPADGGPEEDPIQDWLNSLLL